MTLQSPQPTPEPRYAFFLNEWHRIAVRGRPGVPAVTGCGLRLPVDVAVRFSTPPSERRCGCAGSGS